MISYNFNIFVTKMKQKYAICSISLVTVTETFNLYTLPFVYFCDIMTKIIV